MHLGRKIWDLGTYLSRSTKYETCWIYLFRPRSRPAKRSARCGGIFIQTCCSEVFHLVEPWLARLVRSELESPWQRRIVTYQEFISRKSNYEQMGNIGFYFFFFIMKILILKKTKQWKWLLNDSQQCVSRVLMLWWPSFPCCVCAVPHEAELRICSNPLI